MGIQNVLLTLLIKKVGYINISEDQVKSIIIYQYFSNYKIINSYYLLFIYILTYKLMNNISHSILLFI